MPEEALQRLLVSVRMGDLEEAKALLLDFRSVRGEIGERDFIDGTAALLLMEVCARDPAWYEIFAATVLRLNIPEDMHTDFLRDTGYVALASLQGEALWQAAADCPHLHEGLVETLKARAAAGPLPLAEARHAMDPRYGLDDATLARCCARTRDPQVAAALLERVTGGGFGGIIPGPLRLTLAQWRLSQPGDFTTLTASLPPPVLAQIPSGGKAQAALPPLTDADFQDLPDSEFPRILEIWEQAGQPVPLAAVAAMEQSRTQPWFTTSWKLTQIMARPEYRQRHLEDIDAEMARLSREPGDRERFHSFAAVFLNACGFPGETGADGGMRWLYALSAEDRNAYLDRYAESDPAAMLRYAQDRLPPGPERDEMVEKATAQLP